MTSLKELNFLCESECVQKFPSGLMPAESIWKNFAYALFLNDNSLALYGLFQIDEKYQPSNKSYANLFSQNNFNFTDTADENVILFLKKPKVQVLKKYSKSYKIFGIKVKPAFETRICSLEDENEEQSCIKEFTMFILLKSEKNNLYS